MTVPAFKPLMAEMDLDTHHGRVRRMALLGRDEGGSVELGDLLDRLTELGGYWHYLALEAAVAAREKERLVAALTSGSRLVRSFAYSHIIVAGLDLDEMLDAYTSASTVERRGVRRFVCSAGQPDVAERLVELCRERYGDHEAAGVLANCRAPFVLSVLPDLDYAVSSWAALGRRHPIETLAHLEALLRAAPRSRRDGIWGAMAAGVRVACGSEPERVLGLLEQVGPSWGPVPVLSERLGALVRAFPTRTTRLLLDHDHVTSLRRNGLPRPVLVNATALAAADQLALAKAVRDSPLHLAAFLDRLPPAERGTLFAAAYGDVDTSRSIWPDDLLEVLPAWTRDEEARRMLGLRQVAEDPVKELAVSSFLPIAEARSVLTSALGAATAEDRAIAYRLLVDCTRRSRSPEEIGATLVVLRRLRNEQDPVRLAAVSALARVPAHLFADAYLQDLLGITTTVVEARDSSPATVGQLRALMLVLLQALPANAPPRRLEAVLSALDQLAGPAGTMAFGQIGRRLPRGAENNLLAALLPRLLADAKRDRYDLTLSLAAGLGRRGWHLDDLQALIGRATRANLDTTVRRAVDLWLAPPGTRGDRVSELISKDPSTLTLGPVLRAVTTRRQDLLDVLFRSKALKGRFLTGNVRHVPIIQHGLGRWLPRQHNVYADALVQLIRDSAAKPWISASAIQTLGRLPQIGAARLEPFLASAEVSVAEAALGALAWTDQPDQQLTRLLGFADSDRARVAIYAAARCARFAPPHALGAALDDLLRSPTAKVTARKEAVRLLAQHRPPGAFEDLIVLAAEQNLHRDVRIAIGRCLRAFLDDPRAWTVLTQLAEASPDEARSLLETTPAAIAERHRRRFGQLVVKVTSHFDQRSRTMAFAVLAAWSPWLPEAADVAASTVQDLTSATAWRPALRSLVLIFADGQAGEVTAQLIERLVSAAGPEEPDAAEDRDRPSRQRLAVLVEQLTSLGIAQRIHLSDDLASSAHALTSDPTTLHWAIALLLSAADLGRLSDNLSEVVDRLADRPIAAIGAASTLATLLARDASQWEPDDLSQTADYLLAAGSRPSLLLCLAIIGAAGPRSGWNPAWRARLRTIRGMPEPDIGAAALALITSQE